MGLIKTEAQREWDKIYKKPANRKLRIWAAVTISIGIVLMLAILIFMDHLSDRQILLMRGFAGLSAIIFVILSTILSYRVNRELYNRKR